MGEKADPDDFADPHDRRFFNAQQVRTFIAVGIDIARQEGNEDAVPEDIATGVVRTAKLGSTLRRSEEAVQ